MPELPIKLQVRPSRRQNTRFGHPWIYKSELEKLPAAVKPGALVMLFSGTRCLGTGYFNPASEIAVRLLTTHDEPIDKAFFIGRFKAALQFREKHVKDSNAYRLVSSEADGLPGLIVDRYAEVLVVQFLTLGMEGLRELVIDALREAVPCKGIFEKSDSGSRKIEGLEERTGWLWRECGEAVVIREGALEFPIAFGEGHKTGFYLDQRDNRLALAELGIKGKALDAFCYSGAFGLHLAKAGAQVLALDSQEDAIRQATANREHNKIPESSLRFKTVNVFDELKVLEKEKAKFELIVLDPPSFVKKREALSGALAGYKEIILRSFKLLNEGGLLAVFSCSYHIDETLLLRVSMDAAVDTRKRLRIIRFFRQSSDHPIDPFIPETYYLKGFLFSVSTL